MEYCVASKVDFWRLSTSLFGVGDIIECRETGDVWAVRERGNHKEFVLYESPDYTSFAPGWVNKEKRKIPHNCPNCGAPTNPHSEKCEYCDTYYH